jgi:predicted DNA-binding transcriptional regulator YafY
MIAIAMRAQDDFAIQFTYRDRKGVLTRRVVSPVRFVGQDQFAALCLCREEVRQFVVERCTDVVLLHASEVLMPVQIEELEDGCGGTGADHED